MGYLGWQKSLSLADVNQDNASTTDALAAAAWSTGSAAAIVARQLSHLSAVAIHRSSSALVMIWLVAQLAQGIAQRRAGDAHQPCERLIELDDQKESTGY